MCNHYRNNPEALSTWAEYVSWNLPRVDPPAEKDMWPKKRGLVIGWGVEEGEEAGCPVAASMMWGIPCQVPGKRPGTKLTKHVTNVRNLESPFWRSMLNNPERRCLVPFTSFAEPVIGGGRAEHWFTVRDRPVSMFAGIWRPTEQGDAFAFLTCEPNALVAPLHPKAMPVILDEAAHVKWLTADWDEAKPLVSAYPSQLMAVESPAP
jgi:putative SOS response-associated peptidase YedK